MIDIRLINVSAKINCIQCLSVFLRDRLGSLRCFGDVCGLVVSCLRKRPGEQFGDERGEKGDSFG